MKKITKTVLKVLICTFLIYSCIIEISYSQTETKWPNILFIFDSSGSMYGRMGNEAKIDAAKRVLKALVEELPETVNIGLMFFGNKIKGRDCIRFPIEIKRGTKQEIIDLITTLAPGGLTPLAGSLQLAGDYLEKNKIGATVILITDGKEECGGDPLAVAKSLYERGIDIKLHIVGLAVSGEEKKQLEEIAKLCGGAFYSASNAGELANILKTAANGAVAAAVAESPPSPVMKLTAPSGQISYSRILHSVKIDETVKIKFKPLKSIGEDPKVSHAVLFRISNWQLSLADTNKGWQLTQSAGDKSSKIDLPEGLKINRDSWNEIKILRTKHRTYILINDKNLVGIDVPVDFSQFKVGVTGYEAEFTELAVQLPMY
ncbi:MAG: VWA domain-containing protein [Elusimicrobiota bacterium]|nr:VWA domain-containing protein [Elusimicrobiota bacterium]